MAFTGESKYGLTDGQHLGNWSASFPLFARVVNGVLYPVAREDHPDGTFGKVVTMSRDWLRGNLYNGFPTEADLFADKPNLVEDTSVAASEFIKTTNDDGLIAHPNPQAAATTPTTTAVTTPAASTTADATTTTPAPATDTSVSNAPTTDSSLYQTALVPTLGIVAGGDTSTSSAWGAKMFLGVIAVVAVIIGAVYLVRKRKKQLAKTK